jgi:hypothetical protein
MLSLTSWIMYRWGVRWLSKLIKRETRHLVFLSVVVLLGFGAVCEMSDLGFTLVSGCIGRKDWCNTAHGSIGPA